jgi:hypothetical protein
MGAAASVRALPHVIGRARRQLHQHDIAFAPFNEGGGTQLLPHPKQQFPHSVPRNGPVLDGRQPGADQDRA